MIPRLVGVIVLMASFASSARTHAQDGRVFLNWPEPAPFLEGTKLFWTLQGVGNQGDQRRFPHVLEADIFPHFIVAFGSRCRGQSSMPPPDDPPPDLEWNTAPLIAAPCISVTPAVRLRMLNKPSVPVPATSFMPRVNVQWLFWGDNRSPDGTESDILSNLYVQVGHHSNGESGCLFTWTGMDEQDDGACADNSVDSRDRVANDYYIRRGYIEANKHSGNFTVNYIKLGFDRAINNPPGSRLSGLRWGVSGESRHGMYGPLRGLYAGLRLGAGAGISIATSLRTCGRLDKFVEIGWHWTRSADSLSFAVEGTCVWSETQGTGFFVRYYSGHDYYNASFLDTVARIQFGFTINRLKVFGLN